MSIFVLETINDNNMDLAQLDKVKDLFSGTKQSTVKTLLIIICCISKARSSNLNILKCYFRSFCKKKDAKIDSYYKRLTRFFVQHSNEKMILTIYQSIVKILGQGTIKYAVMDGTSWEFGEKKLIY